MHYRYKNSLVCNGPAPLNDVIPIVLLCIKEKFINSNYLALIFGLSDVGGS